MTKRYEELLADMTGIIAKIYEKGYDKGYEQGKIDQRMETAFEDVKRVVNEDTAQNFELSTEVGDRLVKLSQERRDEIIERAKKDVEELRTTYLSTCEGLKVSFWPKESEEYGFFHIHNVDFIINTDKRTVVALIKTIDNAVDYRGIAKCAPSDCFNVHIGKAIALRRALGLEVPDEYLNAPQPTEVRVGDVIRMKYYNPVEDQPVKNYERIIKEFGESKVWYEGGGFDYRADVDSGAKIIDDSRDGDE